jgi:hypothetical protein
MSPEQCCCCAHDVNEKDKVEDKTRNVEDVLNENHRVSTNNNDVVRSKS